MTKNERDDLRSVFRHHLGGIALAVLLLLTTLLAGAGLLGLSGHFLVATALAGSVAAGFNLFGPSAGIRALTFARILSRYGERLLGHQVTLALARDLRVWFFRRALPLAPLGLGRYRVGDLLARLVADIEAVDGWLVRAIGPLLALGLLWLLGIAITMATWMPSGWLLASGGMVIVAISLAIGAAVRRVETARAEVRAELRYTLLEGLDGATDLMAFDADAHWRDRAALVQSRVSACELRRKCWLMLGATLQGVLAAVLLPGLAWQLFDAVHRGQLEAPVAAGVFFMTLALLEAAAGIGLAWQAWEAARVSAARLQSVAGALPLSLEPATPIAVPAHGDLVLEDVSVRWPEQTRDVLSNVDFVLPAGRRIAIRGDSGTGKSTLMALVLRLRDPDSGRVCFAGVDLRCFATEQWQRRLAWLPQEAPIFAGSVRENLRMGDPEADEDRLWDVLARVRLDGLIRGWTLGLDGWVGENGTTLSAGQARRLALARALLREAPLLLLDEPTEGLDQDTAHALMTDVASLAGPRSVLIITHAQLPPGTVHETWRLQDGRLQRTAD